MYLSKKHVFTSTSIKDKEERTVEFRISKGDKYVPDESRLEAVDCMIEITKCILSYLRDGYGQKKSQHFRRT